MNNTLNNLRVSFLDAINLYKNNIAIKFIDHNITYGELFQKANNLFASIRKHNIASNKIGLLTQRSEAAYVGVASAILHNYTYVPLNPKLPPDRLKKIVESGEVELILTDKEYFSCARNLFSLLDKKPALILYETIDRVRNDVVKTDNNNELIYLLFTSGSTGTPKGVPINNKNLCAFLNNINTIFDIKQEDILSQTFDLSFDLAMFDILVAWLNGATLCPMSTTDLLNPIGYVLKNKITVWFAVPSLITNIRTLGKYHALDSIRLSIFCGEVLHQNEAKFWQEITTNSTLYNIYGPTEITIACSYYKISYECLHKESATGIIPIGFMFNDLDYVILNAEYSDAVGNFEIGELCVSGTQVFDGYIGTERNSFVEHKGYQYYKTGDLVRKNHSGVLEYISRSDGQVKINGFRIELGEIEHNIKSIDGVINAVVVVTKESNDTTILSAFIKGYGLEIENIKAFLATKLPKYMIPKNIKFIEEIPLNINGKIDRKALAVI